MCTKIEHHKVDKTVDNIVHKPKYKKKQNNKTCKDGFRLLIEPDQN